MSKKNSIILEKYVKGYLNDKIDLIDCNLDLVNFSNDKTLFDYQQRSLENIARLLIHYFNNDGDKKLIEFYSDELEEDTKKELSVDSSSKYYDLLKETFGQTNNLIPYTNFLNRASFWMATGSGKTLIIVKLIELLYELMIKDIIPPKKVLIITPNDEIFSQIKNHVDDFNDATFRYKQIFLRDIKEYEQREFAGMNPLLPDSLTVYYTKSTLLSDENKENLIDFKSYIEKDGWYIILDEAHKGDAEESIRKQYINILAKNGFLFNFSATFTDKLDIISTIVNFNLTEFIKDGYGKNIKVLDAEFKNFKAKNKDEIENNLSDDEKKQIILKSLIIFTAIKKNYTGLKDINDDLYHNPLMLTISNEINTDNADMKLYFKYLADIAAGNISEDIIDDLKQSIAIKLRENLKYSIGNEFMNEYFIQTLSTVSFNDILRYVFNSESQGNIEVYQIGSNNNELSFHLKTSIISEPFAIIKASNVNKWRYNVLEGYTFNEDIVIEKSRFKNIHEKNNKINILMGSRQFIEGWDSNRPNVINFINMGTNDENTKLILQAIGRGVRIEPLQNIRKRFKLTEDSINAFEKSVREKVIKYGESLETLFVFATNKQVIVNILNEIDIPDEDWKKVSGIRRTDVKESLHVPVYETIDHNPKKFKISRTDFNLVEEYIRKTSEKLLVIRDDFKIKTINDVKSQENIIVTDSKSENKKPVDLLRKIEAHSKMKSKVLVGFREEIKYVDITHYEQVKTSISEDDLIKLENFIKNTLSKKNNEKVYNEEQQEILIDLVSLIQNGKTPSKSLLKVAENLGLKEEYVRQEVMESEIIDNLEIELKNINAHYYQPLIISSTDRFKNTVSEESEINFINHLQEYINSDEYKGGNFDWWYFSKLIEGVDSIKIPYYDTHKQIYRDFYPDFIFWMKKDEHYYMKFVDPKGLVLGTQNVLDKINGFEDIFTGEHNIDNMKIHVQLLLYNDRPSNNEIIDRYRFYDMDRIFNV